MNEPNQQLDNLHHVACVVRDVVEAAAWYRSRFRCVVAYQDETWALLKFANASLALVTEGDHPAHLGFVSPAALDAGTLKTH
jgi:catechol 2,3-dioxygenase-like lactoylglutathione lyase family enzyme